MSRVVDMWLEFELVVPTESNYGLALIEFHNIWPRSSEPQWKGMLVDGDDAQLRARINAEFIATIATQSPSPVKNDWTFDAPLSATGWKIGPKGLHERSSMLVYTSPSHPSGPWQFPFGSGAGDASVFLHTQWRSTRALS